MGEFNWIRNIINRFKESYNNHTTHPMGASEIHIYDGNCWVCANIIRHLPGQVNSFIEHLRIMFLVPSFLPSYIGWFIKQHPLFISWASPGEKWCSSFSPLVRCSLSFDIGCYECVNMLFPLRIDIEQTNLLHFRITECESQYLNKYIAIMGWRSKERVFKDQKRRLLI